MKMRTLRRLRTQAPRHVRRSLKLDATIAVADEPAPEAVFDRITGPYAGRTTFVDEET